MTFEVSHTRMTGGVGVEHEVAAASTYASQANRRRYTPPQSATSNSSGFYTKNTFNSHQNKKTVFERVKYQSKILYSIQIAFGIFWIICSAVVLRPPAHCFATACISIA